MIFLVLGTVAFLMIWHGRESAFDDHLRGSTSMGVVLSEQTARYIQVVDLIVQEVKSRAIEFDLKSADDFEHQMGTSEMRNFLRERVRNVRQADVIVVINADGLVTNSSRPGISRKIEATNRDYYKYFRDHDDPGIFVGALAKGRVTGDPSLYFARRVNGPSGEFLGVILGVVDVRYLSEFYPTATEHVGMSVTLARRDGAMLVRYPNTESAIGVFLPQSSPWHDRVPNGGGNYITPGLLEKVRSLVTVHPLREYPLVADVLQPEALVYSRWRTETFCIVVVTLVVAFTFSGLMWVVVRQNRLQRGQNARLEDTAAMLRDGQETLRGYAEMSADWFWEQDADLRYRYDSNIPFMTVRDDAGKSRRALADPAMNEERWLWHEQELAARAPFRDFRWERIASNGSRHFTSTNGDPVFGSDGSFIGYRGTGHDITLEVRASERLARTNRQLAEANANLEMGRQQIEAVLANITQGVFLFDGAERLMVWNRRWVELYNLPPDAACVGRPLREVMEIRTTVGSAVAIPQSDHESWSSEIRAGSEASGQVTALKNDRAKTDGRGKARFFEPEMNTKAELRRVLECDLREAIPRDEFELHYQPLVSVTTGTVSGFEALPRWHHPIRGMIYPMDFIAAAEETGMIVAIGEWVLRTACLEAEGWPDGISVAVNLSPIQFEQSDIVAKVRAALAASGLEADRLELEITESVLLRDTESTLAALLRSRAMGITIALDDFGTRYSSRSYLRSFPFDKIKIDKSFVRDLATNRESMSIVRAVTGHGHSLDIKTTAEGVETFEQLDLLREHGCTEAQGYLFGRPSSPSELPTMIGRLRRANEFGRVPCFPPVAAPASALVHAG